MLNGMMYKILLLILIFVFGCAKETTNTVSPTVDIAKVPKKEIIKKPKETIQWQPLTDKFVEKSLKTRKMVFVYIYTDWCPHCSDMEKTLKNKTVIKQLNKNFLSTKINGDIHPRIVKMFIGKEEYPATVFLYPDVKQDKVLYAGSVIGFIPEDIFIDLLNQLLLEKQKIDEQTSH